MHNVNYHELVACMIYAGILTMPERRTAIHCDMHTYALSGGPYAAFEAALKGYSRGTR